MVSDIGLVPTNGRSLGITSKIMDDVMNVLDSAKATKNKLFISKSPLLKLKPAKYTLVSSMNAEALNRIKAKKVESNNGNFLFLLKKYI